MEIHIVEDGLTVVDQLISGLVQQQKKEENVMDNLNELLRELDDQETRRYNTAKFRWESTSAEMEELERLRSALVSSRRGLVLNTATEQTIHELKAALKVENAHRDELDQLPILSPHEQRRARATAAKCSHYVGRILERRKSQTAFQGEPRPAVLNQSGGSMAAAWSSFDDVVKKFSSPIRVDSPTRPEGKSLLRAALASFSLDGPVSLKHGLDADELSALRSTGMSHDALLQEGNFYELIGSIRPSWVKLLDKRSGTPDGMSAAIVYGSIEWIGKLFATPYSQPFFIGSELHKATVAELPDICFEEFITVDVKNIKWDPRSGRSVLWTAFPTVLTAANGQQLVNQFLKVIPCSSYDHLLEPAGFFRRLYKTYERYGAALAEESASMEEGGVPQALSPARLWCGIFAVVVTMEFVEGKEATEEQLAASTPDDEKGARAIASAVVWLARRGLIYYDLREPNIRIDAGGCWHLIDYDDMVVVEPGSINTVADIHKVLDNEQHVYHLDGVLAAFNRFPKLLQFINDAFRSA
ncbi:hypothetical protein I4F81_003714 [Pyropia yezoensis]|uniref:Uncharacterized protein n=1 Tax=Pyropia yezoensis TaxID=2788 RepID=A0ACC3BTD2_PYRYE|nr:hypothetical protein I4F81_003714 [Neopyropia yezoensis]